MAKKKKKVTKKKKATEPSVTPPPPVEETSKPTVKVAAVKPASNALNDLLKDMLKRFPAMAREVKGIRRARANGLELEAYAEKLKKFVK